MGLPSGPAVVLTREAEDNAPLAAALKAAGVPFLEAPCTATRLLPASSLPAGVAAVLLTSRRGVAGLLAWPHATEWLSGCGGARPLVGAVGAATAARLAEAGVALDVVAEPPRGEALARMVAERLPAGASVAVVRGTLTSGEPETTLARLGMSVVSVVVYENVETIIPLLSEQPIAAVLAAAPSAARRLLAVNPWLVAAPFVVPGATTAAAVRALGVGDVRSAGAALEDQVDALIAAYRAAVEGR